MNKALKSLKESGKNIGKNKINLLLQHNCTEKLKVINTFLDG